MTIAADRRVPFEGATNFRDLGGYRTADGGRVQWRLVYRADGLQNLTPRDLQHYETLGIRAVYDLRRDEERETSPNRVSSLAMCVTTPVEDAGVEMPERVGMLDHHSGEQLLRTLYGNMLAHSATVVGRMFTAVSDPAGLPAVFHCHAGKDRTGLVAALLLEALRVDRDVVLDDYELTSQYRRREHQEGTYDRLVAGGMAPEAAVGVLGAPRWAMAETLADLDDEFGGIEPYLLGPAAMERAAIERLRDQLVVR